ncbi:MAG: (2Fe-2S) ferredoxin domain-containing protein [Acidobacteria bacterium]|nr:(2Fe-2S) ferredoxin domain-containing protein [Acidobacteriota bacterium]
MAAFERHLFVCGNQRAADHPRGCCDPAGGEALHQRFKKAIADHGLSRRVRANRAGCLDQCEHGPTVVVYPDAVWYGGVTAADVDEIVATHLMAGDPVARLRLAADCINTGGCEHKPRPSPVAQPVVDVPPAFDR